MQDTIQTLVSENYKKLEVFILSYIPQDVQIESTNKVNNVYENVPSDYKPKALFSIDLFKTNAEDAFVYSNKNPYVFVDVVLQAFDKA